MDVLCLLFLFVDIESGKSNDWCGLLGVIIGLTEQLMPLYLTTLVLCCTSVMFHRCVALSQNFIQNGRNEPKYTSHCSVNIH